MVPTWCDVVSGDAILFRQRVPPHGRKVCSTVSGTPTTTTRWIEGTSTVTVTDGRLTIRSGAGAINNKICFVEDNTVVSRESGVGNRSR